MNREIPLAGLHGFFDHCETISDRNIERIKALGGGIALQDRMAFQGEYFVERYGAQQAARTPPIHRMLEMGGPVGAGTDGTRVSSYNPFVSLGCKRSPPLRNTSPGIRGSISSGPRRGRTSIPLCSTSTPWSTSKAGSARKPPAPHR